MACSPGPPSFEKPSPGSQVLAPNSHSLAVFYGSYRIMDQKEEEEYEMSGGQKQRSKLRGQHEDKPGLVGWVLSPCISIKALMADEEWFNAFLGYSEMKGI